MANTNVQCKTLKTRRKNKNKRLLRLIKTTVKNGVSTEKAVPITIGERGGISANNKKSKSRRYLSSVCKRRSTPYFKKTIKRRIKQIKDKKNNKK